MLQRLKLIYLFVNTIGNTEEKEREIKLMNTSAAEIIEAEYDAFCLDRSRDLTGMYELLYDYIYSFIAGKIKHNPYIESWRVEEFTQETMIAVAKKIHTYEKKEAKFTTFCCVIAKNKIYDYVRKEVGRQREECQETEDIFVMSRQLFGNPERILLLQEYKLEQIVLLKKYLRLLMSQKGKPYRTAACCYAMILFHKYYPKTKELSSPKWAFEEIHDSTVEESADRFEKEINQWFPGYGLYWGEDFLDEMEEKENGFLIADMVYEEHFKVKDFENWSLRMRKKIKDTLLEQELEMLL